MFLISYISPMYYPLAFGTEGSQNKVDTAVHGVDGGAMVLSKLFVTGRSNIFG